MTTTEHETERPHAFRRIHARLHRNPVSSVATKVVVTIIGVGVIVAGLIMFFIPGPGIVAVVVGLGILATEWAWAERWVVKARDKARETAEKTRNMDPAVRRRRIILGTLAVVVVVGAVTGYVAVYDWPRWSVEGWNWVQDFNGVVPEIPGM